MKYFRVISIIAITLSTLRDLFQLTEEDAITKFQDIKIKNFTGRRFQAVMINFMTLKLLVHNFVASELPKDGNFRHITIITETTFWVSSHKRKNVRLCIKQKEKYVNCIHVNKNPQWPNYFYALILQ